MSIRAFLEKGGMCLLSAEILQKVSSGAESHQQALRQGGALAGHFPSRFGGKRVAAEAAQCWHHRMRLSQLTAHSAASTSGRL